MSWANYHSHTHYCDGKGAPEAYLEAAEAAGMRAYGISSHAPAPIGKAWTMRPERLEAYIQEIRSLASAWQGRLQVYAGLEIDFLPQQWGPGRAEFASLDYRIGSVHVGGQLPDGAWWEIDGGHAEFLHGVERLFGGDAQAAVRHYFGLVRQMLEEDRPELLGHLDKIKIQSEGGALFRETDDWYRAELLATFEVARSQGVMVEVNTRGIYKGLCPEPYPGRWALQSMQKMGIPIVLNSDAHRPGDVQACFAEVAELLQQTAFRHLHALYEGEWQPFAFSSEGILFPATSHR